MVFSEFELEELNRISQDFQEVSAYMREIFISLVLFTNKWEGLSKAAIEAYSFGLPLLLSNVQGNKDMIKGNGFLFDLGDVENLKKILIEISDLSEVDVQDNSKRSRSMFEAKRTLESIYNI
jgi:glycosyltransferase involved in cell wall biosynthesis|tara:strand:- start:563 stop:928 length:366 start_codon:yes stop_codon:yes gene_type:complete